jgi:hypothetical protein
MSPSFSEQLASPDVQDGYGEKQHRRKNKNDVQHIVPLHQSSDSFVICSHPVIAADSKPYDGVDGKHQLAAASEVVVWLRTERILVSDLWMCAN